VFPFAEKGIVVDNFGEIRGTAEFGARLGRFGITGKPILIIQRSVVRPFPHSGASFVHRLAQSDGQVRSLRVPVDLHVIVNQIVNELGVVGAMNAFELCVFGGAEGRVFFPILRGHHFVAQSRARLRSFRVEIPIVGTERTRGRRRC